VVTVFLFKNFENRAARKATPETGQFLI